MFKFFNVRKRKKHFRKTKYKKKTKWLTKVQEGFI